MRQLPDPPKKVNLQGCFMGVYIDNGAPVIFTLEDVQFLPIFSTPEKYYEAIKNAKLDQWAKIQVITDHAEFLDSVMGKIRVMYDPWLTDRGTTRFTELTAAHLSN